LTRVMPKPLQISIIRKRIQRLVREGRLPDSALELDLEALVDPTLSLPENWENICKQIGVDPRFPSLAAPRYWSKMDTLLPEVIEAYERALFDEQARRFEDVARQMGLSEDVISFFVTKIRDQEIALADAIDIVTKYRDRIARWIEECAWDIECVLNKYKEAEKEMARKKDQWRAVVELLGNLLSPEEREILLDPYLPEDIKLALLEERGYVDILKQKLEKMEEKKAPPKPAKPAPPPKPAPPLKPKVAPPPKPELPKHVKERQVFIDVGPSREKVKELIKEKFRYWHDLSPKFIQQILRHRMIPMSIEEIEEILRELEEEGYIVKDPFKPYKYWYKKRAPPEVLQALKSKAKPAPPPPKPRDIHAMIIAELEKRGYRVKKIDQIYEIIPGKYYTVMFQDAYGKWHYVDVRF